MACTGKQYSSKHRSVISRAQTSAKGADISNYWRYLTHRPIDKQMDWQKHYLLGGQNNTGLRDVMFFLPRLVYPYRNT